MREGRDRTHTPEKGAEEEERFLQLGGPHQQTDQLGQKSSSGASEESKATSGRQDRPV